VRLVHDTVEAVAPRRRHIPSRVAALICCGALLAGCGGSSDAGAPVPEPQPRLSQAQAVSTVRQADCAGWLDGSDKQRRNTVLNLRKFAGGPVGSSKVLKYGRVLDDVRAYKLLDSWCKNYFARGFKLYKLYERAAAFVGRPPKPGT
jgi:hypothetical protein